MRATWNGTVRAESNDTVVVEGNHSFPPDSLNREAFTETDTTSHRPWKGDANFYSVQAGGGRRDQRGRCLVPRLTEASSS